MGHIISGSFMLSGDLSLHYNIGEITGHEGK